MSRTEARPIPGGGPVERPAYQAGLRDTIRDTTRVCNVAERPKKSSGIPTKRAGRVIGELADSIAQPDNSGRMQSTIPDLQPPACFDRTEGQGSGFGHGESHGSADFGPFPRKIGLCPTIRQPFTRLSDGRGTSMRLVQPR